jgi:ketosteroid isomerase-like protein
MKRLISSFSVSCLFALAVVTVAGCSATEQGLPKEVITSLEKAFNAEDLQACVDLYTDDAEILSEDAPAVRGKQAIAEFYKDQINRPISFDTDTTLNVVSGNLGIEQGTYQVRNVRAGTVVEYGEFLNIWKRVNGQWKNYRSMFNVTQAPRVEISVTPAEEEAPPS